MRILDWIIGREPVASATGIAAVITAVLGAAAAFGLDISAEQIAALGALAAAVAGWMARKAVVPVTSPGERQVARSLDRMGGLDEGGSVPLGLLIFLIVVVLIIAGIAVSCDAMFEDEDETNDLGQARVELAYHDDGYGDDEGGYRSDEDYDNGRDDNRRGGISPGPFDRSPVDFRDNRVTICFPFARCDARDEEPEPSRGPIA